MTDHYTTLGLNSAATLADVKKAFRQKASFLHPDKNAAAALENANNTRKVLMRPNAM